MGASRIAGRKTPGAGKQSGRHGAHHSCIVARRWATTRASLKHRQAWRRARQRRNNALTRGNTQTAPRKHSLPLLLPAALQALRTPHAAPALFTAWSLGWNGGVERFRLRMKICDNARERYGKTVLLAGRADGSLRQACPAKTPRVAAAAQNDVWMGVVRLWTDNACAPSAKILRRLRHRRRRLHGLCSRLHAQTAVCVRTQKGLFLFLLHLWKALGHQRRKKIIIASKRWWDGDDGLG